MGTAHATTGLGATWERGGFAAQYASNNSCSCKYMGDAEFSWSLETRVFAKLGL
jgi:hypothetical protein